MEAFWTLSSSRGCTGTSVMWVASLSFPYIIPGISRESEEDFVHVTHPTCSDRPLVWFAEEEVTPRHCWQTRLLISGGLLYPVTPHCHLVSCRDRIIQGVNGTFASCAANVTLKESLFKSWDKGSAVCCSHQQVNHQMVSVQRRSDGRFLLWLGAKHQYCVIRL